MCARDQKNEHIEKQLKKNVDSLTRLSTEIASCYSVRKKRKTNLTALGEKSNEFLQTTIKDKCAQMKKLSTLRMAFRLQQICFL